MTYFANFLLLNGKPQLQVVLGLASFGGVIHLGMSYLCHRTLSPKSTKSRFVLDTPRGAWVLVRLLDGIMQKDSISSLPYCQKSHLLSVYPQFGTAIY